MNINIKMLSNEEQVQLIQNLSDNAADITDQEALLKMRHIQAAVVDNL